MDEDEMRTIFFNSPLNDINLYDYIDASLLVNGDTPVYPVENGILTKVKYFLMEG